MAYLSWIVAQRNDGYPPDQADRLNFFIDFLGALDRKYPNTFELVVCDWNPPSENRTMAEGYDWSKIENLTIVTVPPDLHKKIVREKDARFVFSWANNVALRAASGTFIARMNPDVFPSAGIAKFLGERRLSPKYFYRADRCDYIPDYSAMKDSESAEGLARKKAIQLFRRGRDRNDLFTIDLHPGETSNWVGTTAIDGEIETDNPTMILPTQDEDDAVNRRLETFIDDVKSRSVQPHRMFTIFGLHTNASGDFIVASRKALEEIHGFVETTDFTAHDDSYALVQLRALGYRQAIFRLPEAVFHADHERGGRTSRPELIPYEEHEKAWTQILSGRRMPQINGSDWGLADYKLPVMKMKFGQPI